MNPDQFTDPRLIWFVYLSAEHVYDHSIPTNRKWLKTETASPPRPLPDVSLDQASVTRLACLSCGRGRGRRGRGRGRRVSEAPGTCQGRLRSGEVRGARRARV